MTETVSIQVRTDNPEAAEQFIRDYALEAIDRLPETDNCEEFMFYTGGEGELGRRSAVILAYIGDVDAIIKQERSRLEAYVEDGVINEWDAGETTSKEQWKDQFGENTGELALRLNPLETRIAQLVYREFDDLPAAVDTYPEEDGPPIGWWGVMHTVTVQLNYGLDEELDAYIQGIDHTLRNFATHASPEDAEARLDDTIERLEAKREEIKEGRHDS